MAAVRTRREIWSMAARHGGFAIAPALITLFALRLALEGHVFAVDFEHSTWVAGRRLLLGASPYVGPGSPEVAAGAAFVYPALAAVLSVPFSLLPRFEADVLFTGLSMVAVVLALRALEVRDWRIYGLVFLWPAVISGWQTANLSLLLCLAVALLWRWRDRPAHAGLLLGLLIGVKLFLWPLGLWLLATRRWVAGLYALVGGIVLSAAGWAIVGFDQIGPYVRLMGALTKIEDRRGYSLVALAYGDGRTPAYVLTAAAAIAIAAGAVALGRRGRDRAAFAVCVVACLVVSPLVWLHYFALLCVPLALARPRLAAAWFLPLMMLSPPTSPRPWQVLVALGVAGVVVGSVVVDRAPSVEAGARGRDPRFAIPAQRSRGA